MIKNSYARISLAIYLILFWTCWAYLHYTNMQVPAFMTGDEAKYMQFADNIHHGFYSKRGQEADLWYTPGYPFILAILTGISKDIFLLRCTSALFIILAYTIMARLLSKECKIPLLFSLTLGSFIVPWYQDAVDFYKVHTESFVYLVFTLLVYAVCKARQTNERKHIRYAGIVLGYLAITKVFFIYIIAIVAFLLFTLKWKYKLDTKPMLQIHLASSLLIIPYLLYSFYITGKPFYTSSSGGMQLIFMTTPLDPDEPNWMTGDEAIKKPEYEKVFAPVDSNKVSMIEFDQHVKKAAISNLRSNPSNYIKKILHNPGWLFGYRLSRDSILHLILYFKYNSLLTVFFITIVFALIGKLNCFDPYDKWLLLFCCTYLFFSLFLTANLRFFLITLPVFFYLSFKNYHLHIWPKLSK